LSLKAYRILLIIIVSVFLLSLQSQCGDWPTFRHDNSRSGASHEKIERPIKLKWVFKPRHAPSPAWPLPAEEAPRSHVDNAFHVAVADNIVYFGSSVDNKVYALDLADGRMIWTYMTEGPVRFAPAIYKGKVYFGSDDGYVYCVDALKGSFVWKYRLGPDQSKAIGNGAMISAWPIRTSVLVDNDEVLCSAGVFPFEGIYICSLNSEFGILNWRNDTLGDRAHDLQFGGVSPQGYLLASKKVLYIPSGRCMPAAIDRSRGEFLFYATPGAKQGGTFALLDKDQLIAGTDLSGKPKKCAYNAETGAREGEVFAWFPGVDMAVTADFSYTLTKSGIHAIDREAYQFATVVVRRAEKEQRKLASSISSLVKERKLAEKKDLPSIEAKIDDLAEKKVDLSGLIRKTKSTTCKWRYSRSNLCSLILAGDTVFTGGDCFVAGIDSLSGEQFGSDKVKGVAAGLAVANGSFLVSTDEGMIYCFGKTDKPAIEIMQKSDQPLLEGGSYASVADKIIEAGDIDKGYCLVVGASEGLLEAELAERTDLKIICIEDDPDKLKSARKKLDDAGLYGARVVVEPWSLESRPPYFANLVVTSKQKGIERTRLERVLRPCGGALVTLDGLTKKFEIEIRGELEGAGVWTHQYGNPQNTACSMDQKVKGPFGVQWYGEPGPVEIVDRHGRAASPVSIDGRVFHQGEEVVMAYDAYNGAFLWKREIPGAVRVRADVDSSNMALSNEGLYIAAHDRCYRLDPATGETVREYTAPPSPDGSAVRWGYIAVHNNILYGTAADPLAMEYAAAWKDLVDFSGSSWKNMKEIPSDVFELWGKNSSFKSIYQTYKAKYPEAGRELYMDFHRAGTLWQPVASFPTWDSQRTPLSALTENVMGGRSLFAMDTDSGELLWMHYGRMIPNISISIGDGILYFADNTADEKDRETAFKERESLVKKGVYEEGTETLYLLKQEDRDVRRIVAVDAVTGKVIWKKPVDVSGCGGDKMGSAYADGALLFFGHFSNHDTKFFLRNELAWRRITALEGSTGEMKWSRPLNYLRRPLIVSDTVIIEPRACELHTGKIKQRTHPISSLDTPFEFLRPGHCCSITSASAHALFYRSYYAAIYELKGDKGLNLFGAIRPGCWLNMIPANGVMVMPEASSGCTCSFPIRCSVALVHRPEKITGNWTVFITHGPTVPVNHLAVNFGAPGDKREDDGTMWFAWPRPKAQSNIGYGDYATKFKLDAKLVEGERWPGYYQRDFRGLTIEGTDRPWLFASGCCGLIGLSIPLQKSKNQLFPTSSFKVRLGLKSNPSECEVQYPFKVFIQGRLVYDSSVLTVDAGGLNRAYVKEIEGVSVSETLNIDFLPQGADLRFIEVIREEDERFPIKKALPYRRLGADEAVELLKETDLLKLGMGSKYRKDLLQRYHSIFNNAAATDIKIKALEGVASLNAPETVEEIINSFENSGSILCEYKEIDPKLCNCSVRTAMQILDKLYETDKLSAINWIKRIVSLSPPVDNSDLISDLLEKLGYLVNWRLLGPIPWEEGLTTVQDVYKADRPVDHFTRFEKGDLSLHWEGYSSSKQYVDLKKILTPKGCVSAYAYNEFNLEEDCEIIFKVGSNDGFKCWLNDELIGGYDEPRRYKIDETVFSGKGVKGGNRLLIQIIDKGGSIGFSVHLTGADGFPLNYFFNNRNTKARRTK